MINFFHNLVVGIVAFLTTIVGVHITTTAPSMVASSSAVAIVATTSTQISTTTQINTSTSTSRILTPAAPPVVEKVSAYVPMVQPVTPPAIQITSVPTTIDATSSNAVVAGMRTMSTDTIEGLQKEAAGQAATQAALQAEGFPTNYGSDQPQTKQERLDAINLQIANLNAQYAQDIKNFPSTIAASGGIVSENQLVAQENAITTTYQQNYNILEAEYQQVEYGN